MVETTILAGDARDCLKLIPDNIVHCVVSSPPYFGLRDYGTGNWAGGDKLDCSHTRNRRSNVPQTMHHRERLQQARAEALRLGLDLPAEAQNYYPSAGRALGGGRFVCELCGAIKTDMQVGLETTPQEYVNSLVEISREIKRVLRPDGIYWLNIGDSYATVGGPYGNIKTKDIIGVPWMLAFALRDDGWYLRSEVIWHKIVVIPEKADRPTVCHERIFMLTKSAQYHFDGYAVDERAAAGGTNNGIARPWTNQSKSGLRNIRTVWTTTPEPAPEFHFAVYVSDIPRRCILSSLGLKGVCARCGVPWRRGDTGWEASCDCDCKDILPGLVLDPFLGSGTTAIVANQLGHDCIGIELNPETVKQSAQRIEGDGRLFQRKVYIEYPDRPG